MSIAKKIFNSSNFSGFKMSQVEREREREREREKGEEGEEKEEVIKVHSF